jgi:hypothetical protein
MTHHSNRDACECDMKTPFTRYMSTAAGDVYHFYGIQRQDNQTSYFYHKGEKTAEV